MQEANLKASHFKQQICGFISTAFLFRIGQRTTSK
ncbi:hypothetical protein LINGRAHAP2_LOCUS14593 [Linum grandiflorum]